MIIYMFNQNMKNFHWYFIIVSVAEILTMRYTPPTYSVQWPLPLREVDEDTWINEVMMLHSSPTKK